MKYTSLNSIVLDVLRGNAVGESHKSLYDMAKRIMLGEKAMTGVEIRPSGRENVEKDQRDQIAAGTYRTQHFEMSPSAQKLYGQNLPDSVDANMAEKSVILHDKLFGIHKTVKAKERAVPQDIQDAELLAKQIKFFAKKMNLEKEHNYVDQHVEDIRKHVEDVPRLEVPADRMEIEKVRRFTSKPYDATAEPPDRDLDNDHLKVTRGLKIQRKYKIIDED